MIDQPSISVCIAAYNGEKYISEQLASILDDLEISDEVVVVDDCSTDGTAAVVVGFMDPRVQLIRQPVNRGHVTAFETAIASATGEVIMLSDQDDVWPAGRVKVLAEALAHADLAVGEYDTFDDGQWDPQIQLRKTKKAEPLRNLVGLILGRRPYLGCVMAFRRELLPALLPFPDYVEAHDHWLAIVGNVRGRTVHVPTIVTHRRLHGLNLSPNSRRRIAAMFRTRTVQARLIVEAMRHHS